MVFFFFFFIFLILLIFFNFLKKKMPRVRFLCATCGIVHVSLNLFFSQLDFYFSKCDAIPFVRIVLTTLKICHPFVIFLIFFLIF